MRAVTPAHSRRRIIAATQVEASSGYKGLGIVKLMGRSSGFIAMQASMASGAGAAVGAVAAVSWACAPPAAVSSVHAMLCGEGFMLSHKAWHALMKSARPLASHFLFARISVHVVSSVHAVLCVASLHCCQQRMLSTHSLACTDEAEQQDGCIMQACPPMRPAGTSLHAVLCVRLVLFELNSPSMACTNGATAHGMHQ